MYIKKQKKNAKDNIFKKVQIQTNLRKVVGDKLYLRNIVKIDLGACFINDIKNLQICMVTNEEALSIGVGKIKSINIFDGGNNNARSLLPMKIVTNSLLTLEAGVRDAIIKSARPIITSHSLTSYYNKHDLRKSDIENENIIKKIGKRKEQIFEAKIVDTAKNQNHPGILKKNSREDNGNDSKSQYFQNLDSKLIDPLSLYDIEKYSGEQFLEIDSLIVEKTFDILPQSLDARSDFVNLEKITEKEKIIDIVPRMIDVDASKEYIVNIDYVIRKSRYVSDSFSKNLCIRATKENGEVIDEKYFKLNLLPHLRINSILDNYARMSFVNGYVYFECKDDKESINFNLYRKRINTIGESDFTKSKSMQLDKLKSKNTDNKKIKIVDHYGDNIGSHKSLLRATINVAGIDLSNCIYTKIKDYDDYSNISNIPFYVRSNPDGPEINIYPNKISNLVLGIIPFKRKITRSVIDNREMPLINIIKERKNINVSQLILIDNVRNLKNLQIKDRNYIYDESYEYCFKVFLKDGQKMESQSKFIETASPREDIVKVALKDRNVQFSEGKIRISKSSTSNNKIELKASFVVGDDLVNELFNSIKEDNQSLFNSEFNELKSLVDSLVYAKIEKIYPETNQTRHVGYFRLDRKNINNQVGERAGSEQKKYVYNLDYSDSNPRVDSDSNKNIIFDKIIYKVTPAILPKDYILVKIKNILEKNENKTLKSYTPARIISDNLDLVKDKKTLAETSYSSFTVDKKTETIRSLDYTSIDGVVEESLIHGDCVYFDYDVDSAYNKISNTFDITKFSSSHRSIHITPKNSSGIEFLRVGFLFNFDITCGNNYNHYVVYTKINNSITIDAMCHIKKIGFTTSEKTYNQNVFVEKVLPKNLKQISFYIATINHKTGSTFTSLLGTVIL